MNIKLVETVQVELKNECPIPESKERTHGVFDHGGYAAHKKLSPWVISLFYKSLALFFLIVSSPLFLLIGIIVKCIVPGPIIYRGTRLGLHKKPFFMYKFRTLPLGAQQHLGSAMVSEVRVSISPFLRLLRDSRLDELPQLINIIRGDMDFIGPRPIRPEIYQSVCSSIPSFDSRFEVRPGLIGFSQLFTPHSTPKRLRAIIDNRFVFIERKILWDILLIFYTIFFLVKTTLVKSAGMFYKKIIHERVLGHFREKRGLERVAPVNSSMLFICLNGADANSSNLARLVDINEEYCRIESNCMMDENVFKFSLNIRFKARNSKRYKHKKAYCSGRCYRRDDLQNSSFKYSYIIEYAATTPFNRYIIEKYFLKKSII